VVESQSGQSNVGFSYRVVAKRKDIAGERLALVERPARLSEPNSIPAPNSRESLNSFAPDFNLTEYLAQFSTGAVIPTPPKPKAPNLERRHPE
jgi:hypothetical protein